MPPIQKSEIITALNRSYGLNLSKEAKIVFKDQSIWVQDTENPAFQLTSPQENASITAQPRIFYEIRKSTSTNQTGAIEITTYNPKGTCAPNFTTAPATTLFVSQKSYGEKAKVDSFSFITTILFPSFQKNVDPATLFKNDLCAKLSAIHQAFDTSRTNPTPQNLEALHGALCSMAILLDPQTNAANPNTPMASSESSTLPRVRHENYDKLAKLLKLDASLETHFLNSDSGLYSIQANPEGKLKITLIAETGTTRWVLDETNNPYALGYAEDKTPLGATDPENMQAFVEAKKLVFDLDLSNTIQDANNALPSVNIRRILETMFDLKQKLSELSNIPSKSKEDFEEIQKLEKKLIVQRTRLQKWLQPAETIKTP